MAGNVTEDRTSAGGWVPGGPALYAARMAANLGAEVDLITRVSREYDTRVFDGVRLHSLPAETACRYANRYDAAGGRTQLLLCPGEPLAVEAISGRDADACILAPAFHEFTAPPQGHFGVRAVLLQGALRATDGERVVAHPRPLDQAAPLAPAGTYAFLSYEDTADADGLARALAASGAHVFVTRAERGATLFSGDIERQFAAIPAVVVDPTGAGDCFAASFVVRMAETGNLDESVLFALAAGSLAVEGRGIAGVPDRAAVEQRCRTEAA